MVVKTKEDFLKGQLLLIDKPLEWTSFQAVNKIRWGIRKKFQLKKIKVGHAGTLDPLATGLLLICTGKYTKRIPELQGQQKEYTGTVVLGATTPSYDLETQVNQTYPISHIDEGDLHSIAQSFIGEIQQVPPLFSAIKKNGKRLYEMARQGKTVQIESRPVTISEFTILEVSMPQVHFKVACSKGTYIRSLAHDFGRALGTGGYLSSLRRTKIGDYNVNNAVTPLVYTERFLGEHQG